MSGKKITNQESTSRRLDETAQIFSNGDFEFRIRIGVWNFEEAVLDLTGATTNQRDAMIKVLNVIQSSESLELNKLQEYGELSDQELNEIVEVLEHLTQNGFLTSAEQPSMDKLAHELLGKEQYLNQAAASLPVLFFSDNSGVIDYVLSLAEDIKLPITIMGPDDIKAVSDCDLTTRFQAYDTKRDEQTLVDKLSSFSCVAGCFERPRVNFLRNLNRALVETSNPMVLSMVDGPFNTLMAIKPPETGCFECFEARMMARMEDRTVYSNFVRDLNDKHTWPSKKNVNLAMLHGLASQTITEAFLFYRTGVSRLTGRVQSTYLPLLEVQVQDLLRTASCPGCGAPARAAHMEEMYVSMEKLIEETERRISVKVGRP